MSERETAAGSGGPSAPVAGSFGRRAGRAARSFGAAWVATGAAWTLWTRPWRTGPLGETGWADTLWLLLAVGAFAAIGWIAVVLPLVRFGNHGGRFFDPRIAPAIGFVCGVALLLAEYAVFFGYPPWEVLADLSDPSTLDMLLWAGAFGAVLWWHYARSTRRSLRADASPDRTGGPGTS